jgi:glycosyltransferase involved in cell wall biosynthesis
MTRIGIIDLDNATWTAGGTYSSVTAMSLARASARSARGAAVCFISPRKGIAGTEHILREEATALPLEQAARWLFGRAGRHRLLRGESHARRMLHLPNPSDPMWLARRHDVDVLFPVISTGRAWSGDGVRTLGWIPDFQHLHLPDLFSSAELQERRRTTAGIARNCDAVVLSSKAVADEFVRAFPAFQQKARVLSFPSRFAFHQPRSWAADVRRAYHLPEKYFLCANQFWAHKNHSQLVDALALLRDKGLHVHVVFTGLPLDSRSKTNEPTSQLLQALACNGLWDRATVLGLVPGVDFDGLLRGACAVVQPSLHEGWSTTVQDAQALGRPVLCSDLEVLREQAPNATFFNGDVDELADALAAAWVSATGQPDSEVEELALAKERDFASAHGGRLLALCEDRSG